MLWLSGRHVFRQNLVAMAAGFLLLAVPTASAWAGDSTAPGILGPGDAVVTGFSGTLAPPEALPPGADPLDFTFIDPDGASMQIERMLPAGPPAGQLIDAPALVNVPARDVGQVFAVTLDDAPAPNIYLGATSSFGIHIVAPGDDGTPRHVRQGMPGAQFMQGQWGTDKGGAPGSIYKVDGRTGVVTLFSSIGTNAGPGLGDVVFDRASHQLFASDLDTGLIYRLDAAGLIADTFDHGVSARPGKGLAPVADDGSRMDIAAAAFNSEDPSTWGLTQTERRVGGMAVHGGRLFYAVAEGPQIWSIGIGLDGTFRGDARWELDVTGLASNNPVTDIAFDQAGRMILAQRGPQRGSFDYSVFAEPETSSVVRYMREIPDDPATPGTWVPVPDEYAIGFRPDQRNTDGGVALGYGYDSNGLLRGGSCNAFLWTTGEALRDDPALAAQLAAGGPATVDGLQGNDSSLVKPANSPPFSSYFTDYDGNFDHPERQGWMGDIEIYQPCAGGSQGYYVPGYDLPPGWVPPPSDSFNLTLDKEATPQVCLPGGLGWLCLYTIRVTNTGSVPYWGPLSVHDWMPAAAPGALVNFDFQPPWICGATGPVDYQCDLPGIFLFPGEGVDLYVTVEQPLVPSLVGGAIGEGLCFAGNGAELLWWDEYGDDDPWDDFDYAEAQVPDPNCLPQGGGTNLSVQKRAFYDTCPLQGGSWNCEFLITVTNTGPGVYNGPISVNDTPSVVGVVDYGPQPNPPEWNCVPAGGGSFDCNHAPVSLNSGQSVELWFSVKVPANVQEQAGKCSVENTVRITEAPGGSPGNINPGDDQASAEARTPGRNCEPPQGRRSDLSITKVARGCNYNTAGAALVACGYQVLVKNEGPDAFAGMVTVHDVPDPVPATTPEFIGPWACAPAGDGFNCTLDFAGAPLAPGDSRPLNMLMHVEANSEICEVRNQARIASPAGGSESNSNAGNDATGVIAQPVPLRECQPPQTPSSNLVITKTEQGCTGGGATNLTAAVNMPPGVTCSYQITVRNEGPGDVNESVTIVDMPLVAGSLSIPSIPAGWDCAGVGPLAVCGNDATGLASGAAVNFTVEIHTTAAQARQNQCRIGNRAWINSPLGAPLNSVAVDDVASAFAAAPVSLCTEPQQIKSTICPTERQMPDQGCCPEGEKWNGRKCSGGATTTPPRVCPDGTKGTYPDCRTTGTKTCPPNTTGKYPDCRGKVTKFCPTDSVGKYPNCQCPRGSYGSPGNCRKRPKQCPTGTIGKWPNCDAPKACPTGTYGKWPNCQPNVCPQGTIGKWPNCERRRKCPAGTLGQWPNCKPIEPRRCPKGTYGIYPNCRKIGTDTTPNTPTTPTTPRTPNTDCPEGMKFSNKKHTCVPDKKQRKQPQTQLQQAPLKISPELLNQQPQ